MTDTAIPLPEEDANYVEELVRSGAYASPKDVVRAGLQALRDRAEDQWLRDEIGPAYDAAKADPSRAIPIDQAFAELRARIAARTKR